MEQFVRNEILIGIDGQKTLNQAKVMVFGLGGVGGAVAEGLARSGIGSISICDNDTVNVSNINRQIIALNSTIGQKKVDAMEKRILDINSNCKVIKYDLFLDKDSINQFYLVDFDFVIDAIDCVPSKVLLIKKCNEQKVNLISCMGTGNRLSANFVVDDISKTSGCPLAKKMRKLLLDEGIKNQTVLYSKDLPVVKAVNPIGSISFAPNIAGYKICEYVINRLIVDKI